jgi:hypothetical protein
VDVEGVLASGALPGPALFLAGKRCVGEATLDAVLAAVESTERSGER